MKTTEATLGRYRGLVKVGEKVQVYPHGDPGEDIDPARGEGDGSAPFRAREDRRPDILRAGAGEPVSHLQIWSAHQTRLSTSRGVRGCKLSERQGEEEVDDRDAEEAVEDDDGSALAQSQNDSGAHRSPAVANRHPNSH